MSCATCTNGFCRRRGVTLPDRLHALCGADRRYAELFDRRFGVTDAAIVPASFTSESTTRPIVRQANQKPVGSSIGTRLMEIFHRESDGEVIPCDDCKREIIRLNSSTPTEVERDRETIIDGIVQRSQKIAPRFYQRLAIKADTLLGTGRTRAYFNRCLDEAIRTGATPDPVTVEPARAKGCTTCNGKLPKTVTQTIVTPDRTAPGSSRKRDPKFVPPEGIRVATCVTPRLMQPVAAWESGPRHLAYHIFPIAGNGVWQWNVAQLLQRIDQFDGVRSVAVLTADDRPSKPAKHALDPVEEVQRAFDGHRIDNWIVTRNLPHRRETATHRELIRTLPRCGSTFYAHAKGVTHAPDSDVTRWTDLMYQSCLDSPSLVAEQLQQFYITGPFKARLVLGRARWHYSGSFYWFRNDPRLLSIPCPATWFGVEEWPGTAVDWNAAGALFGEGFGANRGELYKPDAYTRLLPMIAEWRQQHV